ARLQPHAGLERNKGCGAESVAQVFLPQLRERESLRRAGPTGQLQVDLIFRWTVLYRGRIGLHRHENLLYFCRLESVQFDGHAFLERREPRLKSKSHVRGSLGRTSE